MHHPLGLGPRRTDRAEVVLAKKEAAMGGGKASSAWTQVPFLPLKSGELRTAQEEESEKS